MATLLDFETQASRRKASKDLFVEKDGAPKKALEDALDHALAYARMTTDDASPPRVLVSRAL